MSEHVRWIVEIPEQSGTWQRVRVIGEPHDGWPTKEEAEKQAKAIGGSRVRWTEERTVCDDFGNRHTGLA